jgi:hypothetical protein
MNMSKYEVRPAGSGVGFDIIVVGGNGSHNTLLGFATEIEVEEWIARDKRLNDHTDPFMPRLMTLRRAYVDYYASLVIDIEI